MAHLRDKSLTKTKTKNNGNYNKKIENGGKQKNEKILNEQKNETHSQ